MRPLAAGWLAVVRMQVAQERDEVLPQSRFKLATLTCGDGGRHSKVGNPSIDKGICNSNLSNLSERTSLWPLSKVIHTCQEVHEAFTGGKRTNEVNEYMVKAGIRRAEGTNG